MFAKRTVEERILPVDLSITFIKTEGDILDKSQRYLSDQQVLEVRREATKRIQ